MMKKRRLGSGKRGKTSHSTVNQGHLQGQTQLSVSLPDDRWWPLSDPEESVIDS